MSRMLSSSAMSSSSRRRRAMICFITLVSYPRALAFGHDLLLALRNVLLFGLQLLELLDELAEFVGCNAICLIVLGHRFDLVMM